MLVGPGGTSQTSGADQFTYLAVPSVTSISPAAGPEAGGTTVTILGTGFSTATEVDFNGSALSSFTINSDTSISATSPDLGITGTVGVTVLTAGGTSPADTFTYDATPSVTGVSPAWGSANGATVTITGTDLEDAGAVYFGSNLGTITSYSPGQLQAVAPAGSPGMVHVTVVTPGGTSATSSADGFTYIGEPVTAAASYSVTEGSILSIPASTGVLANDTDPQGLPLTASLLAEPLDGTLWLNSDGSFTYTPNSGYVGTDALVYQASNGYLDSNPTLVTLTVTPATLTWDGATSGDWAAPQSHWTGANLPYPDATANAIVDTPSLVQVTSAQAANALAISGGGQVAVAANASLVVTSDTSLTGGGTLNVNGLFSTGGTFTLDTGGSLTGGSITAAAYQLNEGMASANLSGPGGLTKGTSGTVILSGSNSYAGGTVVNAGTLVDASANSLPDGTSLTVGAGGVFVFDPSQAASSVSAAGVAASAPVAAAASAASTAMVTASTPANAAFTVSESSTTSVCDAVQQVSVVASPLTTHFRTDVPAPMAAMASVTSDVVFKSYRSPSDRSVSPADDAHSARPWAWLAAIETFWNSAGQNQKSDSAVAALDEVLARFGV